MDNDDDYYFKQSLSLSEDKEAISQNSGNSNDNKNIKSSNNI